MGIQGLWKVIGEGEVVHIADLAARHYAQHKRPLRIAVDEACWRFTNLTSEQVERIRDGEPAANPVERVIMFRILRLLKLNIQLWFVFDGQRHPYKDRHGGHGAGRVDKELIKLLQQLLDHLKIKHHQAPGEAEAECAAMQREGIVDAVWADDGDALMFGCTMLIKAHKSNDGRVKDHVRIYTAQYLLERFSFDVSSLVLFAMLSGGDYRIKGVPGCGPETARMICRRENEAVQDVQFVELRDVPFWRAKIEREFQLRGKSIDLPPDFPYFKALNGYRRPAVSYIDQSFGMAGSQQPWGRNFDQTKLRVLLRHRFNFRTHDFIKHIAPICLARTLAGTDPVHRAENLQFGVQKKRTRKVASAADSESKIKSEVKITFSPLPVLEIDLSCAPPEEDWSAPEGKDEYNPLENIECEILSCFLDNGLPEGSFEPPAAPSRAKRKTGEAMQTTASPGKRAKTASKSSSTAAIKDPQPHDMRTTDLASSQQSTMTQSSQGLDHADSTSAKFTISTTKAKFRLPSAPIPFKLNAMLPESSEKLAYTRDESFSIESCQDVKLVEMPLDMSKSRRSNGRAARAPLSLPTAGQEVIDLT